MKTSPEGNVLFMPGLGGFPFAEKTKTSKTTNKKVLREMFCSCPIPFVLGIVVSMFTAR